MFVHSRKFLLVVFVLLLCFSISAPAFAGDSHVRVTVGGDGTVNVLPSTYANARDPFGSMFSNYKTIANAILGICGITAIIFFLINIVRLGSVAGSNEMLRRRAIVGLLFSGLALTLLGGLTIVVNFSMNLFK